MKKSQIFEWQLSILALGYLITVIHGTPLTNIRKSNPSTINSTTVTTPNSLDIKPDDKDVFVPYQDGRFSVFDWNICKLMANKYQGNLLISPLSVKLALVLLYEGAQDQTAHELANVMHLPVGRWDTRKKFSVILRSLKPVLNEYELDIGTRMYIESGVDLKQSYAATVKSFYDVDVVPTNFTNSRVAVAKINNWVSNVTHKNIDKIIEDDENIEDSVMLVMNALYFKGSWHKNRFSPDETRTGKFYKTPDTTIDVQFMNTNGNFYYSESLELDAKILRIPYVGHKFAMYFVLPRTRGGLDDLVKNINPFVLTRHIRLMQDLPVEVQIPKFKFDFTSHLETTLRELGIRDIFDNSATFNGIARAKRNSGTLVVSDIVQKAGIEVNERGTTAYATTEIRIGNKMAEQEFIADHPFLFFIEDEITRTILYMGRLSNPLDENGSTDSAIAPTFPNRFNEDIVTEPTIPGTPAGISNTERYNFFNIELLQAVNEESDGNVVVSPLSVKAALMALVEGTGGRTRQELLSTLRLPTDVSQIRNIARRTLTPFHDTKSGTEIHLATRVWTASANRVSVNYNNALQTYYNGDIRSVDFTDSKNSASVINEWVRLATKDNIRTFVEPGSVSPDTILLLTSAVYFKGRWLKEFDKSETTSRCFRVPNRGCQNVPMMENVSKYKYAVIPSLDAEVAEIPYADGKLSMLVFLPHNEGIQSLHTLSRDMSYTPISRILESLRETELLVALPRFSVDRKHDLRSALESMGIKDLFDLSSNISGILPKSTARVGSVIHEAKIEVNEVGTVASAATGISITPLMGNSFESFRVDRPFLFTIVDRPSSAILFAGRVVEP